MNNQNAQTTMVPAPGGSKLFTFLIIGIVVGFLIGYFVVGSRDTNGENGNATTTDSGSVVKGGDTENPSQGIAIRVGKDALLVEDQKAGAEVKVTLVEFENPGFVSIHQSANGAIGTYLGSTLFPTGRSVGIVKLSTPMVKGQKYIAVLRDDNGDSVFTQSIDVAIPTLDGKSMMMEFAAK